MIVEHQDFAVAPVADAVLLQERAAQVFEKEAALLMEFVLHGLAAFSMISKKILESRIEFKLDPEDFGAMQRALHNEAAAAISSNSGYLDRIQGDGGCAYFGLPEPNEDAA